MEMWSLKETKTKLSLSLLGLTRSSQGAPVHAPAAEPQGDPVLGQKSVLCSQLLLRKYREGAPPDLHILPAHRTGEIVAATSSPLSGDRVRTV